MKETNRYKAMTTLRRNKQYWKKNVTEEIEKSLVFTKQKYDDVGPKSLKILGYRLRKQNKK